MINERRAADAQRKAKAKVHETEEEAHKRRELNAQRNQKWRGNKTAEEKQLEDQT